MVTAEMEPVAAAAAVAAVGAVAAEVVEVAAVGAEAAVGAVAAEVVTLSCTLSCTQSYHDIITCIVHSQYKAHAETVILYTSTYN